MSIVRKPYSFFAVVTALTAVSVVAAFGDIAGTRAAIERWTEVRRIISQEKRDWQLGKEMLEQRMELVQREIDAVQIRTREAEQSVTETDKKRQELVDQNDKLKAASGAMLEQVAALEDRTRQLLPRLPETIRERVKPLSQRLPDPSLAAADIKPSLAERYQNVIGILNEINKFNREITVMSEVRSLHDGTSAEVTTMYIGISHGFYVGVGRSAAPIAGIGTSTASGWTWTPADHLAPQITRAIAIYNKEQIADYVGLPLTID